MKASIRSKLEALSLRYEELGGLLSDANTIRDLNRFRTMSKEYADLAVIVREFRAYADATHALKHVENMQKEADPELKSLIEAESQSLKLQISALEESLQRLLLPKDPNDERDVFLEIRAGAGGDEASLFAAVLYRMYTRFAERQGWRVELISESQSEAGGFKEVIVKFAGLDVYGSLKFESGVHRVQRVPVTESQGRIHTSTCTVAVMPLVEEIDSVVINDKDVRIDTYRASGAGGQHVNRTDSAVRLTHLPTGLVVECQDERSQHKNKDKAFAVLRAKLLAAERSKQKNEQAATRRNLVGSGDRSERIRTYNFPQGRLTDHRINLTLYKLEDIVEGDLLPFIEPLLREFQANQLALMKNELI